MTKELLLHKLNTTAPSDFEADFVSDIIKFFESNVCIPKCENRHKDSDILHEWIEGIVKCEYRSPNDPVGLDGWHEMTFPDHEYRIKPSEPIYEWQCIYKPSNETEYRLTTFMSQGEIMEWKSKHGNDWNICFLEETKRLRIK